MKFVRLYCPVCHNGVSLPDVPIEGTVTRAEVSATCVGPGGSHKRTEMERWEPVVKKRPAKRKAKR